MGFGKMFLLNLGLLITVAYLANVIYKYAFTKISFRMNYILSVVLFIFAGWICMKFGFQLSDNVIFDLRIVPLIIASAVYAQPFTLLIIGVGIGLARLTLGVNDAAIAGLINLSILGVVCAGLNIWMRRSKYRLAVKGLITIAIVNVINTINISVFGVIPVKTYMLEIMPITLPLTLVLSAAFALILWDFQLERRQTLELKHANELLRKQTEELRTAKIVLEERARQLAQASQYKSEFLANMSHELRTPLNSIINLAQIISENESGDGEEADEDTPNYGMIIYKSGQDLLGLINDVLDFSKVEAGKLEVIQEEVVIAEMAQIMEMHFEHAANQKEINFEIRIESGLPCTILSDAQRIGQILRNLLSNAFKFTHRGQIKLEIRKAGFEDMQRGEWIIFAVTDTGIGIPEDKHTTIFEAFRQADGSISRKYGGTGLGLPISRDLARLLGGFIRLQSKEGLGSTFSLYLPLTPDLRGNEPPAPVREKAMRLL
ncbi:two-component system chemotaxis sensor kinase CheA [Fontibacillus phaseoli]|uniref:Circadian input-output histidine kinase CikA n=1 Tax=Fontibacillus phaseoli TaxID=1416533 RepID=A0A369AZ27_9BACL|nr:ATP-binding protein [Fontibacillus phaseoli]RCX13588.1 two-component system chemotaxis sensor kinase CheA [Fontibacillus phaseoli]